MKFRHFVISASLVVSCVGGLGGCAGQIASSQIQAGPNPGTPAAAALVGLVEQVLAGETSTSYVLGADAFDLQTGSYHLDCSGYTNNLLARTAPKAYAAVKARSVRGRPLARHYYELFSDLGAQSAHWEAVRHVANLRPGDVLSWKYSQDYRDEHGVRSTGHVMIVMAQPTRAGSGFAVRVSDAAYHPHSDDTRPAGTNGVGAGVLRLDVDSSGAATAFHATLQGPREAAVWIAAARPRN